MITADTETAGFYGPLRAIGWYDGQSYQVSRTAKTWWKTVRDQDTVCYFHNLDFDVRKLAPDIGRDFQIDWAASLVINGRLVRARLINARIELADSFALLPSSLDELCRDFALPKELAKIHLDWKKAGYKSQDEYFSRVPYEDPDYQAYLRNDVKSLHYILGMLQAFAGLSNEDFERVPTAASLALKTFRRLFAFEYDEICRVHLRKDLEDLFREGLYGGRTEVFRTRVSEGEHYDVNGLYLYVMGAMSYPVGYPRETVGHYAWEDWRAFQAGFYRHGMFTATVRVPDMFIPPLPYRLNGRLTFPVGTFTGTWVGEELREAVQKGVEVLEVERAAVWENGRRFFAEWADLIAAKKARTVGAERATWKLLGNALFGKFGMEKMRPQIWRDTADNRAKAKAKGYPVGTWYPGGDLETPYLEVLAPVFAPYVQPQIAAYITAYARIVLYRMLSRMETEFGGAFYCDTDSGVSQSPIDPEDVHPKKAGAWKHEGHVTEGIFMQPKFYAELRDGREILRSKGLLGSWRDEARYALYQELYHRIVQEDFDRDRHNKPVLWLYQNRPGLRKFISAVKQGVDPNTPALFSKGLRPLTWPKRQMDFQSGMTWPWDAGELEAMEQERLALREQARQERTYLESLRRTLWHGIMPKGLHDRDYPDLPRALRRRQGVGLDVAATELGYDGPDALYRDLVRVFKT